MTDRLYQELHLPLPVNNIEKVKPKNRGVAVLNSDGTWEEVPVVERTPEGVEYTL